MKIYIKKYSWLIVIIIFLLIQFLAAISDYGWADKYISNKNSGWVVYKKFNKYIEPIAIYSIFKTPTSRIGFVSKNIILIPNTNIFYVSELWADKNLFGGEVTEEIFTFAINCDNYKEGWGIGGTNLGIEGFYNNNIEWSEPTGKYSAVEEELADRKIICQILHSLK